jgi:predicted dehydrogenase
VGFGTPDFKQEWRITAGMGGGTIYDFGPHWFDQILSLVPGRNVVQVFADVRHFKWGDADDYFDVKLVFDDGCRATASKCDVAYVTWPKWMVFGSTGGIRYNGDVCTLVTDAGEEEVTEGEPPVDLFANLYAAIREGQPLAVTGEEARRNIQLIDAAFESARAGRSVDVSI